MNNVANSNVSSSPKSSLGARVNAAFSQNLEKEGFACGDKPRVLRMSSTLKRMLNAVDAAHNSDADQIARA